MKQAKMRVESSRRRFMNEEDVRETYKEQMQA